MNTKFNINGFSYSLFPRRTVYMGVDAAPPSPENFTSPEKQSQQDKLNEVSQQSPSQIFNDTISAGTAVKTKYATNTGILASLANDDPLSSNPPGGGSGTTTNSTAAAQAGGGSQTGGGTPPVADTVSPN